MSELTPGNSGQTEIQGKMLLYLCSAGTGKTHSLIQQYLYFALKPPVSESFKRVLAITFTNKAAEEMKTRIMQTLQRCSRHPRPSQALEQQLVDRLGIPADIFQHRCSELLGHLLHNYRMVSIGTIDSFFHRVVQSFIFEIGSRIDYSLTQESNLILSGIVDRLLSRICLRGEEDLRDWLRDYAIRRVRNQGAWDFKGDLIGMGFEIMSENYKVRQKTFGDLPGIGTFRAVDTKINARTKEFKEKVDALALRCEKLVENQGGVDRFRYKGRGPAGWFSKVWDRDPDRNAADDPGLWLNKSELSGPPSPELLELMEGYGSILSLLDGEEGMRFRSIECLSSTLPIAGVVSHLEQALREYRLEEATIFINDLKDFIGQIIEDYHTPFLYEKIGTRYDHFLIDEFQDTSHLQWQNLLPLVRECLDRGHDNLIVGDPKQSIYRFRGGDWRLLQQGVAADLGRHRTQTIAKDRNYRSKKNIVLFNNEVFSRQTLHRALVDGGLDPEIYDYLGAGMDIYSDSSQKPVHPGEEGRVEVEFFEGDQWRKSAMDRTIQIVEEVQRQGYSGSDIAILTRTKGETAAVADAFLTRGNSDKAHPEVCYEVVSDIALRLDSNVLVVMMVSVMQWIDSPRDTVLLYQWLSIYLTVCKGTAGEIPIGPKSNLLQQWENFLPKGLAERIKELPSFSSYEIVEELIEMFELHSYKEHLTYLQEFQDEVLDFAGSSNADLKAFCGWWAANKEDLRIRVAQRGGFIQALTIHKSKGLEFPIVVVPFLDWRLDEGNHPDKYLWCDASDQDLGLQRMPVRHSSPLKGTRWAGDYWQERADSFVDSVNLMYVAFTRAAEGLYVLSRDPGENKKMGRTGDLMSAIVGRWRVGASEGRGHQRGRLAVPKTPPEPEDPQPREYSVRNSSASLTRDLRFEAGITLSGAARGTLVHELLQLAGNQVPMDDPRIRCIVEHPSLRMFFFDLEEQKTEVSFLSEGGEWKRVDRLVKVDAEWHLLDFKTGREKPEDIQQLQAYQESLGKMGLAPLKAYIVYLRLDPKGKGKQDTWEVILRLLR